MSYRRSGERPDGFPAGRRSGLAAGASALALVVARGAIAAEAPSGGGIEILWDAPAECPDAGAIRTYTERLLGQPLETKRSQRIAAQAKVRRNEAGNWELRLLLFVGDRMDEAVFAAKQCRALADATALKVALATDPVTVVESIVLPSRPGSNGSDARLAVPGREQPPSKPLVVALRATGGAGFGPLPGVSPGAGLFGSLQIRSFRAELGGQIFWGTDARYPDLPDVGAHLHLVSAIARGCAEPRTGSLTFPVCLGFEAGFMRGEGFGVASARTSGSAWGALVVGPALRVPLGTFLALWAEVDAVIPVVRPGFHVRNLDTLFVAPSGGSRAWAGVEMNLGF